MITKLDLMDHGTDARDILENKTFPLRRGEETAYPVPLGLLKEIWTLYIFPSIFVYYRFLDKIEFLRKEMNFSLHFGTSIPEFIPGFIHGMFMWLKH